MPFWEETFKRNGTRDWSQWELVYICDGKTYGRGAVVRVHRGAFIDVFVRPSGMGSSRWGRRTTWGYGRTARFYDLDKAKRFAQVMLRMEDAL